MNAGLRLFVALLGVTAFSLASSCRSKEGRQKNEENRRSESTPTKAGTKAPVASSPKSAVNASKRLRDEQASASLPTFTAKNKIGREVLAIMDTKVDPCDDFYLYACGGWLRQNRLPPDTARFGRGFDAVGDRNVFALRDILQEASKRGKTSTKIGRFYTACMDRERRDKEGLTPLKKYLSAIERISSVEDVFALRAKFGDFALEGALFDLHLTMDAQNPGHYILNLSQGGLNLGSPRYYLEKSEAKKLNIYRKQMGKMLELLGTSPENAAQEASAIVDFETRLAAHFLPQQTLRDPDQSHHRYTAKKLRQTKLFPHWNRYRTLAQIPRVRTINVSTPAYFRALVSILRETPIEDLRSYLRFYLIASKAYTLSSPLSSAYFELVSAITGAPQTPPEWRRCVQATLSVYPDLVARDYVQQHFSSQSKPKALAMIQNIEAAFEKELSTISWMNKPTRQKAREKLRMIRNKVGYPEKWRKYKGVDAGESHFENLAAIARYKNRRDLKKLGQSVDTSRWLVPATAVNAFYSPELNEMVFPAGILQPPFFSHEFSTAMNYGAMGSVMGHELTHAFDDSGRKFNARGELKSWWDPAVAKRFETQAACIQKTYDEIEFQPGLHINGTLTLGENIADFGGIKYAFKGYRKHIRDKGNKETIIERLSNEQLFFVAYAQRLCTQSSSAYDRYLSSVDPHSPPKQRVNIPLRHFPEFWRHFQCKSGRKMRSEHPCSLW